jgi:hypothetical protein
MLEWMLSLFKAGESIPAKMRPTNHKIMQNMWLGLFFYYFVTILGHFQNQ